MAFSTFNTFTSKSDIEGEEKRQYFGLFLYDEKKLPNLIASPKVSFLHSVSYLEEMEMLFEQAIKINLKKLTTTQRR